MSGEDTRIIGFLHYIYTHTHKSVFHYDVRGKHKEQERENSIFVTFNSTMVNSNNRLRSLVESTETKGASD